MIELHIVRTSRSYGKNREYSIFDTEDKLFKTVEEAKQFLKDGYGKCKRVNMHQDNKDGVPELVGHIYCFKNADWSHSPVEHWQQQDWITASLVTYKPVLL